MKWSQEEVEKMIKQLEGMKSTLVKLSDACHKLKQDVDKLPTLEETIENIIQIQGDRSNE